jgi:hypothetical protein
VKQDNKSIYLCKEIAQPFVYTPWVLVYEHGSQLTAVTKKILFEHMYVHNMYYKMNVLAAVVSII